MNGVQSVTSLSRFLRENDVSLGSIEFILRLCNDLYSLPIGIWDQKDDLSVSTRCRVYSFFYDRITYARRKGTDQIVNVNTPEISAEFSSLVKIPAAKWTNRKYTKAADFFICTVLSRGTSMCKVLERVCSMKKEDVKNPGSFLDELMDALEEDTTIFGLVDDICKFNAENGRDVTDVLTENFFTELENAKESAKRISKDFTYSQKLTCVLYEHREDFKQGLEKLSDIFSLIISEGNDTSSRFTVPDTKNSAEIKSNLEAYVQKWKPHYEGDEELKLYFENTFFSVFFDEVERALYDLVKEGSKHGNFTERSRVLKEISANCTGLSGEFPRFIGISGITVGVLSRVESRINFEKKSVVNDKTKIEEQSKRNQLLPKYSSPSTERKKYLENLKTPNRSAALAAADVSARGLIGQIRVQHADKVGKFHLGSTADVIELILRSDAVQKKDVNRDTPREILRLRLMCMGFVDDYEEDGFLKLKSGLSLALENESLFGKLVAYLNFKPDGFDSKVVSLLSDPITERKGKDAKTQVGLSVDYSDLLGIVRQDDGKDDPKTDKFFVEEIMKNTQVGKQAVWVLLEAIRGRVANTDRPIKEEVMREALELLKEEEEMLGLEEGEETKEVYSWK